MSSSKLLVFGLKRSGVWVVWIVFAFVLFYSGAWLHWALRLAQQAQSPFVRSQITCALSFSAAAFS